MIVGGLSAMILFYILGASMFIIWEDWSLFNAFYFCFVTMTTIGFGDMTPSISGKGTNWRKYWQRTLNSDIIIENISYLDIDGGK